MYIKQISFLNYVNSKMTLILHTSLPFASNSLLTLNNSEKLELSVNDQVQLSLVDGQPDFQ